MTGIAVAAIDRPLALRRRHDLVCCEQWFRGQRHYVVKDPVTLRYLYLNEQEWFLLGLLDGTTSLASIMDGFQARFAPLRVSAGQVRQFLTQLHQNALILSDTPGQGSRLIARKSQKSRVTLLKWMEKIVSLRWRGVNPQPLLDVIMPWCGWWFGRAGFIVWLAALISAWLLVITKWDELARRMPEASQWLAGANLPWLLAATVLVKTLHELGHAVMARRAGRRVQEIGLQLFFFLPCLYTNVSDVWLAPSKWQRIAVSAAGIYVELFLAAVAALVWWQAEPGVLASLCQNVMLVSSLGTLVLNGNPLMRYDGYYVLADWLEIPNLERRSQGALVAWLGWLATGVWPEQEIGTRATPWLAMYAVASAVYRAAVLAGFYLVARAFLNNYQAAAMADMFFGGAAAMTVAPFAIAGVEFAREQGHRRWRPGRIAASLLALAGLAAAIVLIPLPQRVRAVAVIESEGAAHVYATVAGTLGETVAEGTLVQAGERIAQLHSPELARDLARLESQIAQQELHLRALETQQADEPAAAAALPAARQSLEDLVTRANQVRELSKKLQVTAPVAGIVLPGPRRNPNPGNQRQLGTWSGGLLEEANRGCHVETGTLVCQIGEPGSMLATVVLDQADVPLVAAGATVWLALPMTPWKIVRGRVEGIAQSQVETLPPQLAQGPWLAQERGPDGQLRPLQIVYQARVTIDDPPRELVPGAVGRAAIVARPQTVAARTWRWLARTFRFAGRT